MTISMGKNSLAGLIMGGTKQEIELGSVGQEQFCRLVASGLGYEQAYAREQTGRDILQLRHYVLFPEAAHSH